MAATNGFKTSVRTGSTQIALMDGWSLNITQGIAKYASFGSTYKSAVTTVKDWSATAKGTLDRSATGQTAILDQLESAGVSADIALRFYPTTATGTYWSGNAKIESAAIESSLESMATVSFNFQGNGALAWTST